MPKKIKIIQNIGIDEAGRGPIAGPVAVGVVLLPLGFENPFSELCDGVFFKDSKKLTKQQREKIFEGMLELRRAGKIDFTVATSSARIIDEQGITRAIAKAIARTLRRLEINPEKSSIHLDGLLKAPEKFQQETITRGDTKKLEIALASIAAKVMRDHYMERKAKKYPGYGFEQHKGYGTKAHYRALKKKGKSAIHRTTFLGK